MGNEHEERKNNINLWKFDKDDFPMGRKYQLEGIG